MIPSSMWNIYCFQGFFCKYITYVISNKKTFECMCDNHLAKAERFAFCRGSFGSQASSSEQPELREGSAAPEVSAAATAFLFFTSVRSIFRWIRRDDPSRFTDPCPRVSGTSNQECNFAIILDSCLPSWSFSRPIVRGHEIENLCFANGRSRTPVNNRIPSCSENFQIMTFSDYEEKNRMTPNIQIGYSIHEQFSAMPISPPVLLSF